MNRQLCSKTWTHAFLLWLLWVPKEDVQEDSPPVTIHKPQSSSEELHKLEGCVQISQKHPVSVWESRILSWKKGGHLGEGAESGRNPG